MSSVGNVTKKWRDYKPTETASATDPRVVDDKAGDKNRRDRYQQRGRGSTMSGGISMALKKRLGE